MKKSFQLVLVLCFALQSTVAQNIQTVIKTEALKMAKALAALDLETYATYTYPTLVTDKEGKEKIKQGVDSIEKYREQFGIKVKSVLLGNPSAVVTYKGVQQCTLPQTMTIEAFMGSMETETTLIGLSNDGKKWYFVDALMYRQKDAKSKLPELSPELVIPPMKQPKIIQAETKKTN
ncbi:MAG: hypothetical protein ABL872_17125 [Lacibacter sp.]